MTSRHRPMVLRRYLRHGMLPQLAAFEAVVRMGNATRAAEALCMAQPTLSGHLRKLSEALDVRLFELQGKRLVPTDAALVLLLGAREVFAVFERCERELADLRPPDAQPPDGRRRVTPYKTATARAVYSKARRTVLRPGAGGAVLA